MTATTLDRPARSASHEVPRISVLMAVYGRADLAVAALAALAEHTHVPFEVVVVDNASPDSGGGDGLDTAVPGTRVIRLPLNVGFGSAITLAAMHARGELLLLLNSDVIVGDGWLPPLLEVLEASPEVAAVSPALSGGNESAVEVGSVVISDGHTRIVPLEEGWDGLRPRAVPYVSAACLLIRRAVFSGLGGFDPVYPRGYYEDVELAFELRARGHLIVCDPRSTVQHIRGASTQRARAIELYEHNVGLFRQRWGDELARFAPGSGGTVRDRDSLTVDRVLVIDDRIPQTDRGSGDPRMARLLTRMAARFRGASITLLGVDQTHADRYAPPLAAAGVEVADWTSSTPEQWMAARSGHYSAVVLSRPPNVRRFRSVVERTQPQAIRVVDVEAIDAVRDMRKAQLLALLGDERAGQMELAARQEMDAAADAWKWADVVTCVSDEEAAVVARVAPGARRVVVAWAGPAPAAVPPMATRSGLVFFGGFMSGEDAPNADAVRHLVGDVLPILRRSHPAVTLDIIGADPTASVRACAGGAVRVVGRVDDPATALARHIVHVAPLRFGAGITLKLVDSMAAGTPFVTTSIGAEGLHLGELTDLLVADTADDLAAKTARLLDDPEAWEHAHLGLRAIAARHFDAATFDRSVDELMVALGALR